MNLVGTSNNSSRTQQVSTALSWKSALTPSVSRPAPPRRAPTHRDARRAIDYLVGNAATIRDGLRLNSPAARRCSMQQIAWRQSAALCGRDAQDPAHQSLDERARGSGCLFNRTSVTRCCTTAAQYCQAICPRGHRGCRRADRRMRRSASTRSARKTRRRSNLGEPLTVFGESDKNRTPSGVCRRTTRTACQSHPRPAPVRFPNRWPPLVASRQQADPDLRTGPLAEACLSGWAAVRRGRSRK